MAVKLFKMMMVTMVSIALFMPAALIAQEAAVNPLPKAKLEGGKPLMECLKQRQSQRDFSSEKLSPQVLSNLLWAAAGINRPDGKRTIPSAANWQIVEVYVATADGLYLYQAGLQALKTISSQDVRSLTGRQPFVKEAPVTLVYVADFDKAIMNDKKLDLSESMKDVSSAAEAGFIGQNVYLFCASEGLSTVIRSGGVNNAPLAEAMKLRPSQRIYLAQTLGYPKKAK